MTDREQKIRAALYDLEDRVRRLEAPDSVLIRDGHIHEKTAQERLEALEARLQRLEEKDQLDLSDIPVLDLRGRIKGGRRD